MLTKKNIRLGMTKSRLYLVHILYLQRQRDAPIHAKTTIATAHIGIG